MNKQRGFIGALGLGISLAIVGGLVAALVASGIGLAIHFTNSGRDEIEAKYAPITALCREESVVLGLGKRKVEPKVCAAEFQDAIDGRAIAEAANQRVQEKVDTVTLLVRACSDDVKRLEDQGRRARAEAAKRKPADDVKLAQLSIDEQTLAAEMLKVDALGLVPSNLTCEQKLAIEQKRIARRDALWARIAKDQFRDFPPTNAPKVDPDAVTIREPTK